MSNVNDILQARSCTIRGNQISLNVTHWLCATKIGTGATLAQAALYLDNAWQAQYKAWSDNGTNYRGTGLKTLYPTPSVETANITNAAACTGGANAIPGQVSGLLSFRTATPGRKGRGRIYPGFMSDAFISANGELTGAGLVVLASIGTAIPTTFTAGSGGNTNTYDLVIYNRTTHAATAVTTILADTGLATQRRRGDFGRTNLQPF